MATATDWRLYQLYMDFGEVQQRRRLPLEAADAFALALYYARRLGDSTRVSQCRELVLENNPNHIGAQAVSAPLFFAQLLMRYPVDEVEHAVAVLAPPIAEPEPEFEPPVFSNRPAKLEGLRPPFPETPIADDDKIPGMPTHHTLSSLESKPKPSAKVMGSDDFLLEDAGLLPDKPEKSYETRTDQIIEWLARGAIAFGFFFLAYLAAELYPMLWNMNANRMLHSFSNDGTESVTIVVDDEPVVEPRKSEHVAVTAAANTPIALPEEDLPPPQPLRITKRADEESTK